MCTKVPPEIVTFLLSFSDPEVLVNVPPDMVKFIPTVIAELPPWKVPPAKVNDPVKFIATPLLWVMVPE